MSRHSKNHTLKGPGAPLTYFNDGGVCVIFLGLKFWSEVFFWVYEIRREFFALQKEKESFF